MIVKVKNSEPGQGTSVGQGAVEEWGVIEKQGASVEQRIGERMEVGDTFGASEKTEVLCRAFRITMFEVKDWLCTYQAMDV